MMWLSRLRSLDAVVPASRGEILKAVWESEEEDKRYPKNTKRLPTFRAYQ